MDENSNTGRNPKRLSGSILKINQREPLSQIDDLYEETVTKRSKRKSKRVSFSEFRSVKRFSKDMLTPSPSTKSSNEQEISESKENDCNYGKHDLSNLLQDLHSDVEMDLTLQRSNLDEERVDCSFNISALNNIQSNQMDQTFINTSQTGDDVKKQFLSKFTSANNSPLLDESDLSLKVGNNAFNQTVYFDSDSNDIESGEVRNNITSEKMTTTSNDTSMLSTTDCDTTKNIENTNFYIELVNKALDENVSIENPKQTNGDSLHDDAGELSSNKDETKSFISLNTGELFKRFKFISVDNSNQTFERISPRKGAKSEDNKQDNAVELPSDQIKLKNVPIEQTVDLEIQEENKDLDTKTISLEIWNNKQLNVTDRNVCTISMDCTASTPASTADCTGLTLPSNACNDHDETDVPFPKNETSDPKLLTNVYLHRANEILNVTDGIVCSKSLDTTTNSVECLTPPRNACNSYDVADAMPFPELPSFISKLQGLTTNDRNVIDSEGEGEANTTQTTADQVYSNQEDVDVHTPQKSISQTLPVIIPKTTITSPLVELTLQPDPPSLVDQFRPLHPSLLPSPPSITSTNDLSDSAIDPLSCMLQQSSQSPPRITKNVDEISVSTADTGLSTLGIPTTNTNICQMKSFSDYCNAYGGNKKAPQIVETTTTASQEEKQRETSEENEGQTTKKLIKNLRMSISKSKKSAFVAVGNNSASPIMPKPGIVSKFNTIPKDITITMSLQPPTAPIVTKLVPSEDNTQELEQKQKSPEKQELQPPTVQTNQESKGDRRKTYTINKYTNFDDSNTEIQRIPICDSSNQIVSTGTDIENTTEDQKFADTREIQQKGEREKTQSKEEVESEPQQKCSDRRKTYTLRSFHQESIMAGNENNEGNWLEDSKVEFNLLRNPIANSSVIESIYIASNGGNATDYKLITDDEDESKIIGKTVGKCAQISQELGTVQQQSDVNRTFTTTIHQDKTTSRIVEIKETTEKPAANETYVNAKNDGIVLTETNQITPINQTSTSVEINNTATTKAGKSNQTFIAKEKRLVNSTINQTFTATRDQEDSSPPVSASHKTFNSTNLSCQNSPDREPRENVGAPTDSCSSKLVTDIIRDAEQSDFKEMKDPLYANQQQSDVNKTFTTTISKDKTVLKTDEIKETTVKPDANQTYVSAKNDGIEFTETNQMTSINQTSTSVERNNTARTAEIEKSNRTFAATENTPRRKEGRKRAKDESDQEKYSSNSTVNQTFTATRDQDDSSPPLSTSHQTLNLPYSKKRLSGQNTLDTEPKENGRASPDSCSRKLAADIIRDAEQSLVNKGMNDPNESDATEEADHSEKDLCHSRTKIQLKETSDEHVGQEKDFNEENGGSLNKSVNGRKSIKRTKRSTPSRATKRKSDEMNPPEEEIDPFQSRPNIPRDETKLESFSCSKPKTTTHPKTNVLKPTPSKISRKTPTKSAETSTRTTKTPTKSKLIETPIIPKRRSLRIAVKSPRIGVTPKSNDKVNNKPRSSHSSRDTTVKKFRKQEIEGQERQDADVRESPTTTKVPEPQLMEIGTQQKPDLPSTLMVLQEQITEEQSKTSSKWKLDEFYTSSLLVSFTSYKYHDLIITFDESEILRLEAVRRIEEDLCTPERWFIDTMTRVLNKRISEQPTKQPISKIPQIMNRIATSISSWYEILHDCYRTYRVNLGDVQVGESRWSFVFLVEKTCFAEFIIHVDFNVDDELPQVKCTLEHSHFYYLLNKVIPLIHQPVAGTEFPLMELCSKIKQYCNDIASGVLKLQEKPTKEVICKELAIKIF